MKRILITGSRTWLDRNVIHRAISEWVRDNVPQNEVTIVVHGDNPKGADRMAKEFAEAMWWLEPEPHPADWSWGKAGGNYRNQDMVDLGADVCLAFNRNDSSGTKDCVKRARAAGIPVIVHRDDTPDSQAS